MARTRGLNKKTTPAGKRTVGNTLQRPSICIRNHEYKRRMEKLNGQKVIFERGIQIEDFRDTPIPEIIEKRKWQSYIRASAPANMSLVKEFYASMSPDEVSKGRPVLVRGHEFRITAKMINAHFDTPNYVDLIGGYADVAVSRSEKLKALRGPANGRWEEGSPLQQSQLPQWLGFLNVFHTYSLTPVLHRTTISGFRSTILYSYVTGTKIDVGQVILGAIIDAGRMSFAPAAKPKQIIFPGLISALLKKVGVEEFSADELKSSTMGNLNYRSWIDVVSKTKGRRKRKKAARGQSSAAGSDSEPEFDYAGIGSESEEEDMDYEAGAGSEKLNQILAAVQSLHSRIDSFEAEIRKHLRMPVANQGAAGSTPGISISEAQAAQRAAEEAAKKRAEDRVARSSRGKAKI